jgi:o-succinylbenzoate synthase
MNIELPRQILESLHVVQLPLVVRFRGITTRETALFRGEHGWGEFSPFLEYGPEESSRWLLAAIEAAFVGWPAPLRTSIAVNATVPAISPEEVPALLARYDGCSVVKVKVAQSGQTLNDDLARLRAVRDHLGSGGVIRADANGGWDLAEALSALTAFHQELGESLEYVEQPCATVEELAEVKRRREVPVLIAADESIRRADDPLRVRDLEAADIVVLKVSPLGGVRQALAIAAECGLPAVVSSELSSSVGLAAGLALAAALPEAPYASGLGTTELLESDVTREPLAPRAGAIAIRSITPDDELLKAHAAPSERLAWWRERIEGAWLAGAGQEARERGWL